MEMQEVLIPKAEKVVNHKNESALQKLYIVSILCLIFMVIEFVGGYFANSISIMSDAAHLLSDFLGFVISIVSIHISRQMASRDMSFGYHRSEVIGALVSVNIIWGLTFWLIYESTSRIFNPRPVNGLIMLITGILGLIFNLLMGVVLMYYGIDHSLHNHGHDHGDHGHSHGDHGHSHGHSHGHEHENKLDGQEVQIHTHNSKNEENDKANNHNHNHAHKHPSHKNSLNSHHSHHSGKAHSHSHTHNQKKEKTHKHEEMNLNIQASIYHVLGDMIQNVGVIISAVIIYIYPNMVIFDPICTYVFSIIVLFTTFRIVGDCIKILMEGSPDMDILEIENDLLALPHVTDIHDVHLWSLSAGKLSFSCHLISDDPQISLSSAKKMLLEKYGIQHATIQVEENKEIKELCEHDLH